MNARELIQLVKREHIKFFEVNFVDVVGNVRTVDLSLNTLYRALNNELMFDGSSVEGFVHIKEADMYLFLDLDSFQVLSYKEEKEGKTASFFADVYTNKRVPFVGDPRTILKNMVTKYRDKGYVFNIGFEPEFYLYTVEDGEIVPLDEGSYFGPEDYSREVRKKIMMELEESGIVIGPSHHEVGPGQNEVNYEYMDVVRACDNLILFIDVVKAVAQRHGVKATFMPKPFARRPGNGMHVNCSIANLSNENLFFDKEKGGLSTLGRNFISGVIEKIQPLCALTNASVNSYKRLNSGFEAPRYIAWSYANRSAMIRVPEAKGHRTRCEIRSFDSTANCYLALSAVMAAGLQGIEQKIEIEAVNEDLFEMNEKRRDSLKIKTLPSNLDQALEYYRRDELIKKTLGKYAFDKYYEAKKREFEEYEGQVHEYELYKYL